MSERWEKTRMRPDDSVIWEGVGVRAAADSPSLAYPPSLPRTSINAWPASLRTPTQQGDERWCVITFCCISLRYARSVGVGDSDWAVDERDRSVVCIGRVVAVRTVVSIGRTGATRSNDDRSSPWSAIIATRVAAAVHDHRHEGTDPSTHPFPSKCRFSCLLSAHSRLLAHVRVGEGVRPVDEAEVELQLKLLLHRPFTISALGRPSTCRRRRGRG